MRTCHSNGIPPTTCVMSDCPEESFSISLDRDRYLSKTYITTMSKKFEDLKPTLFKVRMGTSLVAQWLRIHLAMQGTRVRSLVWEDPTCRGATKPVRHNY
ncbi:hypothetical protein J1605_000337 [Eschrichtius robustus]|uniref:Uncharacterized protein n=1 Tax=Eschrichtius robustus TaxID=9764 RepID=A0AB34HQF6_ESCRO|nr:hypothetical protein J1605_000337 [Eschrichtius robustus]